MIARAQTENKLLKFALRYAKRGWLVLPLHTPRADGGCSCRKPSCISVGKHPRTMNGLKDASSDEATIRKWWRMWDKANIGVVMGDGLAVLDVDPRHDGDASLQTLEEEQGELPPTVTAKTGGGGWHFYFRIEGRVPTRPSVVPGIDLKAMGGYVVAPPSLHETGGLYEWDLHYVGQPAEIPAWLLQMAKNQNANGDRPGGVAPPVDERIPSGKRNDTLLSIAGSMRRRGLEEPEIAALLIEVNARRCDPPLADDEVRAIANSVIRYPPAISVVPPNSTSDQTNGAEPTPIAVSENPTEFGNARRFVREHGQGVRYVPPWDCWIIWDGRRWSRDERGEAERLAKETIRNIYAEAQCARTAEERKKLATWAGRCETAAKINSMLALARTEPGIPATPEELDRDSWLFNCRNGTIDLRTGQLRAHSQGDLITKLCDVDYDQNADAPRWQAFLARIMDENAALLEYIRRMVGYSLTGSVREQVMFILYGTGANGKSTLVETIAAVLGDYAKTAEYTSFLATSRDNVRNDIARLMGARFVSAMEGDEGRRLAEPLVKQITGGDKITARFLHEEFFEFTPQFKLFLATNHKPQIRGTDLAIWRRIRLIPFRVTIPQDEWDTELLAKLQAEAPGILAWALKGCMDWQEGGLGLPADVYEAVEDYRKEMDVLGAFVEDRCHSGEQLAVGSSELYKAYRVWCEETGEKPLTHKAFSTKMVERGHQKRRSGAGGTIRFHGIDVEGTLFDAAVPID